MCAIDERVGRKEDKRHSWSAAVVGDDRVMGDMSRCRVCTARCSQVSTRRGVCNSQRIDVCDVCFEEMDADMIMNMR